MFYIDQTTHKIILTKGDNAEIEVQIKDANGVERGVYADDVLTLTVRKSVNAPEASITKTAVDGVFSFIPEDTKHLTAGSYVYDIQLDAFTGKIYTIIPKSSFVLKEDITR